MPKPVLDPFDGVGMPQPTKEEEMTDLFGNDTNVQEVRPYDRDASEHTSDIATSEDAVRDPLEYDEDDQPPEEETLQRKEADVSIPNIPVPRSSNGETWVIRMQKNLVTVDPKPFHPDTYIGPEQEEEEVQQPESLRIKSDVIKLRVENTVRWRWIKDSSGHDRRQSNSRIIRWSDGSLSLLLGKELFDINQTIDTSGTVPRQSFGGPQPSPGGTTLASQTSVPSKVQGLTYLVAQHKHSQVLQAEAVITGSMTLQPAGMQSETHRMLVRAVGQKHHKVARLRMAPDPKTDPEREKQELMKVSARKAKKKAEEDGLGGRRRRSAYSKRRMGNDVWSDDEDEGQEFAASDEEVEQGADGTPRKKRKSQDSDGKKAGEYQPDDFLVADSTDDEAGEGGEGKRGTHGSVTEEVEEDPLDKLEEQIQEQAEERRRQRESGPQEEKEMEDKAGDEEMDVESEEDGDDIRVRRTGMSSRKKRFIDFEEEDDE